MKLFFRDKPVNLSGTSFLKLVFIIVAIFFGLLRFIELNADFPLGITTSGALYTDEGWYASSAIRQYLTGHWYLEGDINTAITEPGAQVLYRLSFTLLGLSLSSARITVAVSFLLTVLISTLWIRKYYGDFAAVLMAVLLTTNYFAFAYSRLALRFLIALLFIVASLYFADMAREKNATTRQRNILLASFLLAYAILTYTTSLFALPVLVSIAWKTGQNNRERIQFSASISLVMILLVGIYLVGMRYLFPAEIASEAAPITGSFIHSFSDLLRNIIGKIYFSIKVPGVELVGITILLALTALYISRQFRRNPLVHVVIMYPLFYLLALSITSYEPPRYFLLLIFPFTGLCAMACVECMSWLAEKRLTHISCIPVLLLIAIALHGSTQIISYLSNPRYSFYQMAHDVGAIIQQREGETRGVYLFGDIADSISMEIGTTSLNSGNWAAKNIQPHLLAYHPKYLIVHTSHIDQTAKSLGASITQLGSWNVFGNYYADGEPIRLFLAAWPVVQDKASLSSLLQPPK